MTKRLVCGWIVCALALPAAAEAFSLGFGAGLAAGGNLFRVISPASTTGNYTTPDGRPLLGEEFRTELDETFSFALRGRMPVTPAFSISLGLAFTDMDITANRRTVADNVDQIDYDQVFIFGADLSVEYDLLPQGNRPFISAGLGSVRLDFEERNDGESIDQTNLGLYFGGGFRLRSLPIMDIDFEARVARISPDFGAEADRLTDAERFEDEGGIWLWQIGASWVYAF